MHNKTQGDFISDHCLIDCKLNIANLQNDTLWRYCWKIKKMDKEKFQKDLKASLPLISQEPSVDAKTDKYHTQHHGQTGSTQIEKDKEGHNTTLV